MAINFISSKDLRKTCTMTKSDNIKIMMVSETNDIIEKLRIFAKISRKIRRINNSFIFDSVDLLYYHLHRIILKTVESYD